MLNEINLPLILLAALMATSSPGPATVTIAGTAMKAGRRYGLAVASGISSGSLMWSTAAAFGLGAVMLANAWVFELLRYCGAGYLVFLAIKSARSALTPGEIEPRGLANPTLKRAYAAGLGLHLTNPKAILFFGSLYAVGVPAHAAPSTLLVIIAAVAIQSALVFHGYALLFSSPPVARGYMRLRRWFEATFALAFGYAGVKLLTTRLQ
ncbi:LysE family translocator [Ferrovibrio sp.]|uniref:LysE family translocator n=1 Tax=Ferrovibrio sp. TaxID=1917215 RepID=UPI002619552E|nr:LysE family translocator [Ferrovibrio sp.]